MATEKVAIVTGGNAGLGLTLCERLLSEHKNLRLCLACRNTFRAEAAKASLQISHPKADISVVIVDTSKIESVYKAAITIQQKYSRIDYLYLNAGIMPVVGFNWSTFIKGIFSSECVHMFMTGKGLLKQADFDTEEGIRNVFATNVFGHYILVHKLESIMGQIDSSEQTSQIIWTSSSAALPENFNINDIQHKNGIDPYSSSKYATDHLSIALNERLNKKGIYSHSMCPGLVMTNLTNGIMPEWVWTLLWPLMLLIRFIVPNMNYDTYNGCEAQVWLSHQRPETLDTRVKFCSESTVLGKRYVKQKKLNLKTEDVNSLYKQLQQIEEEFEKKYDT